MPNPVNEAVDAAEYLRVKGWRVERGSLESARQYPWITTSPHGFGGPVTGKEMIAEAQSLGWSPSVRGGEEA